jgi:probable phosphoglycerate mutase
LTTQSRTTEDGRRPARQDALDQLEQLFRLDNEGAGELVLVRHARPATRFDAEPPADPMLSCEGLEQAERLAERLGALWAEAVFSAPERRAFQTAKVVADHLQRPLHTSDALAEIEFEDQYASGLPERFAAHPRWESLPGFGDGKAFRRRVVQAIDAILAAYPARRVVVVTHGSVINAYLSMLLAVPRDLFFAPDYASISLVRHEGDAYAVRALNDTAHLAGGGLLDAPPAALTARSLPLTNR